MDLWARRGGHPPGWDGRVVELAVGQHGVVSRRQLAGLGMGRRAIEGRLRRGFLRAGRPGAPALRALLGSEEPGGITRNDFEEAFVALLEAHGLPRPRLNADLWLRSRFVEVDCLWPDQRIALELDGRAVHAREAAFERDKERDRELLVEGWRPARVTWRQLRDEPAAVAADLRELLTAPTLDAWTASSSSTTSRTRPASARPSAAPSPVPPGAPPAAITRGSR